MKKISKGNKVKATAILTSIIWGATVLTGCPQPITPEITPDPKPNTVTLSQDEKAFINGLTGDLSQLINNADALSEILTKYNLSDDVDDIVEYMKTNAGDIMAFSYSSYSDLDKQIFNIGEKKDNSGDIYKPDSYSEYETKYDTAEADIATYDDVYNNDYLPARNAYREVENSYINVSNTAKDIVDDLKDNYAIDGSYDVNSVVTDVQKVVGGNAKKSTFETEYDNAYAAEQTAQNSFNDLNNFTLEKKDGSNEHQGGDQSEVVTSLTVESASDITSVADWSNISSITIKVPDNATEVDVISLVRLKNQIEAKKAEILEEDDSREINISFASYPETVTKYKLDMTDKDNVSVMKEFANPEKLGFTARGEEKTTQDVIPGVDIVTYSESLSNRKFLQSFDFSRSTKPVDVILPSNYNLNGTYKGGIIGDKNKVNLSNLSSTTMSGIVVGKESAKAFYSFFVEDKAASDLAKLNFEFKNANGEDDNLYGVQLEQIYAKYYNNSKLLGFIAQGDFDAKAALQGGNMYSGDTVINEDKIYNLDINFILNPDVGLGIIANLKVTGNNDRGVTTLASSIKNVRFATDMSNITVSGGHTGVVSFEDDAPKEITKTFSKLIFKKVTHDVVMRSGTILDTSALSSVTEAARIKAKLSGDNIGYQIGEFLPTGFLNGVTPTRNYTNQDFEEAANQNPTTFPEISKVLPKSPATNSDLMRTLLEGNQKQYI